MSNIGVLGGTFDPFHLGHLSILEATLDELDFDKVLLMPAKVSPFKIGKKMAGENHRIQMAQSIADQYSRVDLTRVETDRPEVSYTYETLSLLQKDYPGDRLWFILGSDSFLSLDEWYKGKELLSAFSFVLAPRPGYDWAKTENAIARYKEIYGTDTIVLHNELVPISSTEIREALKKGQSIQEFVPESVYEYIEKYGLYR